MKNTQGMEKSTNPLEQFVILAKNVKGLAAADLINLVLESPGIHVFGELLDMPNIQELGTGDYITYFNTLNLFAYGTYKQFLANRSQFLDLTVGQRKKLQHLTLVTLATRLKCIPYDVLLEELDLKNVRDLEDLIIEAIYSDIIQGKLDQKNKQLEVDFAIGRDIKREDIGEIVKTLQEWCDSCEAVLSCIEEQVNRANLEKTAHNKHQAALSQEIVNIKKALKTTANDADDAMNNDVREALSNEKVSSRKQAMSSKCKGLRPTTKFWSNKN